VLARLAGGADPADLAAAFGVGLTTVFRRLVSLPAEALPAGPYGLIRCDAAGAVTFRRALPGFQMPRLGAACPLWPLFQALSRPMVPFAGLIEQASRRPQRFLAWALAEPAGQPGFGAPPVFVAAMLIRAATPADTGPAHPVGTTCRVCPRGGCSARREPSVLPG
jgi:predicted transcriptional regulator